MNFYLFSVFVILCFGPWAMAREVYHRLAKTSAEVTGQTKKLNADERLPIIGGFVQVASQAHTWIQWFRRLLKTLRKWCTSHPHEVKLGKCFASYFNIKTPGLIQYGKIARHIDLAKGESRWKISKKITFRKGGSALYKSQRRIFEDSFLEKSSTFLYFRNLLIEIGNRFKRYRDFVLRDSLLTCIWDYFWKKFWIWVDSTPDSRWKI